MGPQELKYMEWLKTQKENGVIDIRYDGGEITKSFRREELFKELNELNDSIASGKATKIDWDEIEGRKNIN